MSMLRKFLTRSENEIQGQIHAVVERHGAKLHQKLRISDLVDAAMLDPQELGTYALQAYFDFVVIDGSQEAVAVIEFDGPGHDPRNDADKNSICQQANLPLIRVYGFEQVREISAFTLTQYLVELVLHGKMFLQMKEDGTLGPDEPFMLSGLLRPDASNVFDSEFNFVGNWNGKLMMALKNGGLAAADSFPHLSISHLVTRAPDGLLRGFMTINSLMGPIVGTSGLRVSLASPGFLDDLGTARLHIAEFALGMAADDLLENIRPLAGGDGYAVTSADEVLAELRTLRSKGYTLEMALESGGSNAGLRAAFQEGKGGWG